MSGQPTGLGKHPDNMLIYPYKTGLLGRPGGAGDIRRRLIPPSDGVSSYIGRRLMTHQTAFHLDTPANPIQKHL